MTASTKTTLAEKSFAEILEKEPLYRNFENVKDYPCFNRAKSTRSGEDWYCPSLNLPCGCAQTPTTTWKATKPTDFNTCGGTQLLQFVCQSCKEAERSFIYRFQLPPIGFIIPPPPSGGQASIIQYSSTEAPRITSCNVMKIGQWPKLETSVDKVIANFIGKDNTDLLRKAIMSRHSSHGLAALAYLRRIIENMTEAYRTKAIQDGLLKDISNQGYQPYEIRFDSIKDVLPDPLKGADGFNPFREIHAVASAGIHAKSEADCLSSFDDLIELMTHVAREMDDLNHKKSKKALIDRLKQS